MSSQEALKEHILSLSRSTNFFIACTEWELDGVFFTTDFDSCPCGQEIKEHCRIWNNLTEERTFVGNVCIKRFVGDFGTTAIFAGLKRIQCDRKANVNEALVSYAESKGFLYNKEPEFLRQTALKRNLSEKQLAWKEKINRRIIEGIVVQNLSQVKSAPFDLPVPVPRQTASSVVPFDLPVPVTLRRL